MSHSIMFLGRDNKTKLVPASFFLHFRTLMREKKTRDNNCALSRNLINCFIYIALAKK